MGAIPQPPALPLLGNAGQLDSQNLIQSLLRLSETYGPLFRLALPTHDMLVIGSHALVREICDETRFEKHLSGPLRQFRAMVGDALFTAETAEPNWGKAHRILMPAFGPAAMRGYFADMLEMAEQMFTRWERFGPEAPIPVADAMTRLTLDTIALSAFGYRFNSFYRDDMHPFVDAMMRALTEGGARARRLPLQNRLMIGTQRRFEEDIRAMHAVADELVARRRAMPVSPGDLLGRMLSARDPQTGEPLDDENIRHQMVTFLIAGHETTSGLLSFATYFLLRNPDVLARARAEVDRVLGEEVPRFEHVAELVYVDQILRESLRLWPTAPAFAVRPKEDTTVGGHPVAAGAQLLAFLPALHRDPEVWPDPERFDPDRFGPGARERIPEHAWKPFGNGQRACIGRAFALQEATLVLARMLQRFDIALVEPYTLKIHETLTIKPEGLTIRARSRGRTFRARPAVEAAPIAPTAAGAHATPLLVLFGSNSGTSEAFARRVAGDGAARGYAARVAPLDAAAGALPTDGAVVVVASSYNGQPTDDARGFVSWLAKVGPGALAGVRYAVFGCGNRDWDATYQAVPRRLDALLGAAGAAALLPRGEADARGDFFGDFERWYAGLWPAVDAAVGVDAATPPAGPLYTAEVLPSSAADLVRQHRLALATVLENRELVDTRSPFGRSKRHLELALPPGTAYLPGDSLVVLPENAPELVERAARRFGLRPDAAVLLRSTRGAMAASLPTDRPVSVHELLACHVELSAPATRRDVARLADANRCPPHRAHLAALAADEARYTAEVLERRVSVLDLLDAYPSTELSFAEALELLPPMRVRQYSVSSSPRVDPTRCSLTVAVVDAPALSGNGRFRGTASNWLARRRPGDAVPVAVRPPTAPFRPPADNATPMVLVAAGTGLAPFRGFLQDRAARARAGEPCGETLLFFGCDHPDVDFLYRDELEALARDGVVEVLPAYSEAPEGEVRFVQHRLWAARDRVLALLDRGAHLYLCGDGARMAPAVRATLARMRQDAVGGSADAAAAWLGELEQTRRFASDVFG